MPPRREQRVELGFKPRFYQIEAHRKRKRFTVIVWPRRAGKTLWVVHELNLDAARKPNGRYAYIAPLRNQAKSIAWDLLKQTLAPMIKFCTVNEGELSIALPNGATIRLFGADNPDALRGMAFDGVVLDEVAQMKPDLWSEVVRPALADRRGWAIFIGTPKGINVFSELYQQSQRGEPDWYGEVRGVDDLNHLPYDEIETLRKELPASTWAQEMECDFSAGVENALLSLDEVRAAQERKVGERDFVQYPLVMGVDVARYGDDRSCVFMRQGPLAYQPLMYHGLDLMTLAGNVARTIEEKVPDAVFVDQGGVGGGVIDRLRQLGHNVIGIDFGGKALDLRFENRRAEMWWNLAEWVKATGCLPSEKALASDLTAPTYDYANKRGKMALESKDSMKARGLPSPDVGDALALTFAAPVAMRTSFERASRHNPQQSAGSDYDPFAREYH